MEMQRKSKGFNTKLGFILAAAGSAVGLGNVWRFPYFVATYGGGNFLFVYLLLALVFGLMMVIAEVALGRKTGKSPIGAFKDINPKYGIFGFLAALVPTVIFPYYSVIGGWVTKFGFQYLRGGGSYAAADGFFSNFNSTLWDPIFWLGLFIVITTVLVITGVDKGIEKVSVYCMPVFFLLMVGLVIYGLTIPGAMDGLRHYLVPNFETMSVMTFIAAARQIFFSLSLAMGIMITYGSYVKKEQSIEKSAIQIGLVDTGISVIAGMLVVPTVIAIFGEEGLGQGAGLMFITLPRVFDAMPGGNIVGALFFVMMLLAAITSAVSLMEVVVASVMEWFKLTRKKATLLVALGSFLLALPTTLGFGVWSHIRWQNMNMLGIMSFISDTVLIPIVALSLSIIVGWVLKPSFITDEVKSHGNAFKTEKLFFFMIKWVAPCLMLVILVTSILNTFGFITI